MAFRREAGAGARGDVIPFVAGADSVRRRAWWLASRTNAGRVVLGQRDLRLVLMAATHALVIFAIVLSAPLALLLLGPLLLGAPHLIADVRYLLRDPARPIPRHTLLLILLPVAFLSFAPLLPDVFNTSEAEWLAGAVAIAAGIATATRSFLPLLLLVIAAALVTPLAEGAILAFIQLHNAVAVGLWLARWRAPRFAKMTALVVLGLPVLLLCSGVCDSLLREGFLHPVAGLNLSAMRWTVGLDLPFTLALRALAVFAYGQAVHYVVWLRLLPQAVAPGPAPVSFSRGLSALRRSLGRPLYLLAVVFCLAVPAGALLDPLRARDVYLAIVAGHGWLELAVLAHFACRT